MNVHKHMEAIFVVTLVVVTGGTLAFDSLREADEVSVARKDAAHEARTVVVRAPTLPKQA